MCKVGVVQEKSEKKNSWKLENVVSTIYNYNLQFKQQ